ncbi:hypothetical protein DH2020_033919 [Rehmannia glutinosa]|uniref:F-box domain-containing protein n=1 Tax=Rehmannia glutinosa TaxID=99300 RepID=A0ABR0VE46_REHGL
MDVTRKSSRKPSMDRLSALPDDVICHILSFLSSKNSVATSVLGRRWKFLWTFVPNIDLGLTYGDDDVNLWTDTNLWNGFPKIIINRVMLLHKAPRINTFRLCNNLHDCREYELRAWIRTAISRGVRNIEICFNYNIYLPQCLFTYKTLVDLTLICHVDIPVSFDVYLPALKKLTLGIVRYESAESFSRLLSGCPVLEELIMGSFVVRSSRMCFYVCSPTLIRLTLYPSLKIVAHEFYRNCYRVKIDTPALRYLHAYEPISEDFSARALTSLMEADIVFVNEAPIEGDAIYSRNILEFLGRLCNVKCLKLSTTPMKVPDSAFSALTIRENLMGSREFHCLNEDLRHASLSSIEIGWGWIVQDSGGPDGDDIRATPMVVLLEHHYASKYAQLGRHEVGDAFDCYVVGDFYEDNLEIREVEKNRFNITIVGDP